MPKNKPTEGAANHNYLCVFNFCALNDEHWHRCLVLALPLVSELPQTKWVEKKSSSQSTGQLILHSKDRVRLAYQTWRAPDPVPCSAARLPTGTRIHCPFFSVGSGWCSNLQAGARRTLIHVLKAEIAARGRGRRLAQTARQAGHASRHEPAPASASQRQLHAARRFNPVASRSNFLPFNVVRLSEIS
jgi:hypothetical protein